MGGSRVTMLLPGGAVGRFAAAPSDPLWDRDVYQCGVHVLAFPESPVWITFGGLAPVLADRTRVMLHRDGQEFRRSKVGGGGDYCTYLAASDDLVRQIAADVDPVGAAASTFSFPMPYATVDAPTYLSFRLGLRVAVAYADEMAAAETAYAMIRGAMHAAMIAADRPPPSGRGIGETRTAAAHRDLAEAAKELLADAVTTGTPVRLATVARQLHTSPYHLTRCFRRVTGTPMHRHLTDLRIRSSIDPLLDTDASIAAVAHRFGFASHAHFTTSFHAMFGITPSAARTGRLARRADATPLKRNRATF